MSKPDATAPDARHLIWVARNLLWQAHAAFKDVPVTGLHHDISQAVVCGNLRTAIEAVDQMHARLKNNAPVPCKNTTMPPCTDNAWRHFLEHVQECYLPQTPTAAQEPVAWRVYDTDGSEAVYSLFEQAQAAADDLNWSIEPLYRAPTSADEERS